MNAPERPVPRCVYCHRQIYRQRNGDWYHFHNGSVSCHPGSEDGWQAVPS